MVLLKIHKDYMLYLPKRFNYLFILLFFCNSFFAQKIYKEFYKDSVKAYTTKDTSYFNKTIPNEFKDVIHIALQYYPELTNTNIKFKLKTKLTPLAARPTFWAIFRKPSKRKYLVTISRSSIKMLNPILLKNLSFNAQVGVIGHEIGHISFYNTKRGLYFIALIFKHLNKRTIDRFEFNTDKRCIENGLGYQLLSWSSEIRTKLDLTQWGGANSPTAKRERYMNPETINKNISSFPIYFYLIK